MAIPAQAAPRGSGGDDVGFGDLNRRFSRAIINYNAELSGSKAGSLVQVSFGVARGAPDGDTGSLFDLFLEDVPRLDFWSVRCGSPRWTATAR